jgi:MFS family permease
MKTPAAARGVLRSTIPARVDRLPWSRFHTRMVVALGACWLLDGFEITIAENIGDQLTKPDSLGLSQHAIGWLATVYLLGEVAGALFFGRLSDRLGRRRLFFLTLLIYFTGAPSLRLWSAAGRWSCFFCT